MKTLRIVVYGVNGGGMGHLTRLCAVGRWLRRFAPLCGVRPELWFLSSAEGESLLFREGFPSFKIPSKTSIKAAGYDKQTYLALAKQWVWHSLALLRPDLLLVDTFPNGSFQELFGALDLCAKRAFIYRPSRSEYASRPSFQAVLPAYDLIVVPGAREDERVIVPPSCEQRLLRLGPALLRDRSELLPRDVAREVMGIPPGQLAVLVSAGGGGDPGAEAELRRVLEVVLGFKGVHAVVAAGPLYRGKPQRGSRITWFSTPDLSELWNAVDIGIVAAGYNTVAEALHAGVPTILRPQGKVADDQHARAQWARDAGAALLAPAGDDADLRTALEELLPSQRRAELSRAARALVPENHAPAIAQALLGLCLPETDVDAAEEGLSPEIRASARQLGATDDDVARLAYALGYLPPSLRTEPTAFVSPPRVAGDHKLTPTEPSGAGADLATGLGEVLRTAAELTIPLSPLEMVVRCMAKALAAEPRTLREVGGATATVLRSFAVFDDWATVAGLLRLLGTHRNGSPAAVASELDGFAQAIVARQAPLPLALASLATAMSTACMRQDSRAEILQAAAGALGP